MISKPIIRPDLHAGSWYPGDKKELQSAILTYLNNVKIKSKQGFPIGIISPHAGYIYSGQGNAYSFHSLIKYKKEINRVIILGTPHRYPVRGISVNKADYYATPLGDIPVDMKIVNELLSANKKYIRFVPAAHQYEHSIEMELPFLRYILPNFKIVPILVGDMSSDELNEITNILSKYIDKRTVIVVSSDFTHYGSNYGYLPFREEIPENLRKLDLTAVEYILDKDVAGFNDYHRKTGITICGFNPIKLLMNILKNIDCYGDLIHYYRSGDVVGDWSNSVSYTSINFYKGERSLMRDLNEDEKKTLITIARKTLESYVKSKKIPTPNSMEIKISDRLKMKQGAFVTLNEHKRLRGCIGYIEGIKPLWETIVDNTINACSKDYRFSPVGVSEVENIKIEISVMSPLFPIKPDEVVVGKHGLYLIKGMNRGVFLPQVPVEWGWDRVKCLEQLGMKAGLDKNAWKSSDSELFAFTAQVFGE